MATVPNTFCLPVTPFTTLRRKRNHRLLLGHFSGPPQFSISSTQPFRQQFISCRKLNRSVISSSYITGTTFDAFVSEKDKIEEADDSFIAFQSIEDHKFEESDDSLVERVQSIEVVSWSVLWKLVSWHKLRLLASVFSLVGGTICTLTVPLLSATVPNTFCLPLTPFTTLHRKRNHRLLLHRFNKPPPQFSISSAQQFRPQFISCRRKLNRSVISSAYITGPAFDAIVSENDLKFEESDDSFVAVVQPIEEQISETKISALIKATSTLTPTAALLLLA
ncbi:hypothetical protein BC332_08056 [Capsicum chinense]|nr:hypothetical protein BC332_08056 [Capsicum chinense]